MDTISLIQFRTGAVDDSSHPESTPGKRQAKRKRSNIVLEKEREFTEFVVNGKPLSSILDVFFRMKRPLLDNLIGIIGSSGNLAAEKIEIKRLLGKPISDKEIRDAFPENWDADDLDWHMERARDQLKEPEIIIYCCAFCRDGDCGGVSVLVQKTDYAFTWIFSEGDRRLKFEFDKYAYFDLFSRYLLK